MEIKKIKELADILHSYGLTKLVYNDDSTEVILERSANITPAISTQEYIEPIIQSDSSLIEIKSPIVGVFYAAASPDNPPFVSIGTEVKTGDVLCIIEAMKLMNEVVAETDGVIADICVKNGDLVDFGRVLFKIS